MNKSKQILCWYDRKQRSLPWRQTRDPFSIWVSEIMLQQTRVEVVIPYYLGFLERFPTVESLAKAPLEDVLARWSGLGYYRRARQLHAAAAKVMELGKIPGTAQELLNLPGIGSYTSAAIASIAFGEVVAVLDGNVERLLCRHLALEEDPKRVSTRRRLLTVAEAFLDQDRPGDSNQALMELGATLCRPKKPKCGECPIKDDCKGLLTQDPERFPPPRRRRSTEHVELAVAVARKGERVLFFRRSEDSNIMPGLWELPNIPLARSRESMERSLSERYGNRWTLRPSVHRVRHSITFRAITLHVHPAQVEVTEGAAEGIEVAWIADTDRPRYGMSSIVEKVLERDSS
jgi:A/G-specific adenine glycosylase